ncbi:MAG: hypothetical protein OEW39_07390 [Deltaproteobacteria bacterium]|nr:hypothetical protein [Deltaproteobacteria bacterium]
MTTVTPVEMLEGKGRSHLDFREIDQRFQLKVHAFIDLCMPPVFSGLEQQHGLRALRESGVAPVMHYLQFEVIPRPFAFKGAVEMPFTVALRRHREPARKRSRLILDMRVQVLANPGTGDPLAMGSKDSGAELLPAGNLRVLQVLTRPVALAGERQVTEIPDSLRGLKEHPFPGDYPSIESMSGIPTGFEERETGPWGEFRSAWGLHNSDVNQHVNVNEYVHGIENHFARLLWGAQLPLERHQILGAELLFAKPGFIGQAYGIRTRLWVRGEETLLLGGYYSLQPEGDWAPKPSVFVRMQGLFSPQS